MVQVCLQTLWVAYQTKPSLAFHSISDLGYRYPLRRDASPSSCLEGYRAKKQKIDVPNVFSIAGVLIGVLPCEIQRSSPDRTQLAPRSQFPTTPPKKKTSESLGRLRPPDLEFQALASHQCGPYSNPRPGVMWVEFVDGSRSCSEIFSPDFPVFLPLQKPTLQILVRTGHTGRIATP